MVRWRGLNERGKGGPGMASARTVGWEGKYGLLQLSKIAFRMLMMISRILFATIFMFLSACAAHGQDLRPVQTIPAKNLLTLEEIPLTWPQSEAGDIRIRLFGFGDFTIRSDCRMGACPQSRFYLVVYRLDEDPNYIVLVSPSAFDWRGFRIIDVGANGDEVSIHMTAERDSEGHGMFRREEMRTQVRVP